MLPNYSFEVIGQRDLLVEILAAAREKIAGLPNDWRNDKMRQIVIRTF
jgi:hypothetical protein